MSLLLHLLLHKCTWQITKFLSLHPPLLNLILHLNSHLHAHTWHLDPLHVRHILTTSFFRFGSVHGEEMAYVLGMPLVGGTYHFVHNYTNQVKICPNSKFKFLYQERLLSEHVMSFWVNFAKTGPKSWWSIFSILTLISRYIMSSHLTFVQAILVPGHRQQDVPRPPRSSGRPMMPGRGNTWWSSL